MFLVSSNFIDKKRYEQLTVTRHTIPACNGSARVKRSQAYSDSDGDSAQLSCKGDEPETLAS
jgi:hypothetical protein